MVLNIVVHRETARPSPPPPPPFYLVSLRYDCLRGFYSVYHVFVISIYVIRLVRHAVSDNLSGTADAVVNTLADLATASGSISLTDKKMCYLECILVN